MRALPSGKSYGCRFLNTWPTRLQGRISRLPPHIHTLKESSAGGQGDTEEEEVTSSSPPCLSYEWFGLISIISIRVLPVHLLHLSCSRWPQAVNQQYEAVVADNLMLCCLADSKDTFGTTDGRASAASRSICRYPVPGRPQQDWIHEIQPSECPVV